MTTTKIISRIRTMTRLGQPVRVSRQVQHPVEVEQLLLKDGQPAYYTEAEWPKNSHLLRDNREGVGDLRMPRSGRCVLLDGVDDVGFHSEVALPNDLTLACWLKTSSWSGAFAARSSPSQYFARFTSPTSIVIFSGISAVTLSVSALPLDSWVHLALTRTEGVWRSFVDGVQQADEETLLGDMSLRYINGTPKFNGSYKDYVVFDSALTAAQVRALRNNDYHGSPVLDLPLEEESGYTGFDRSGNGHHVTWNGITPSTLHAIDTTVPNSWANEVGYSARINGVRYSEDLTNAAWLKRNGATVTSVAVTGPNGQPTSNRLQTPSGGSTFEDVYQFFSGFTSGASLDVRFYLRDNGSTRRNLGVANRSSSDYGSWVIDLDALDPGWNLITNEHPAVNVVKAFVATSPSLGFGDVNFPFSGDAHDVLIHEVQVTEKTYGGGYVKTTNEAFLGAIQPALNDTTDALGNALQYTGPAPNPGKYLSPTITGNATSVYGDAGQSLLPASDDFELAIDGYYPVDAIRRPIVLQYSGGASGRFIVFSDAVFISGTYYTGISDGIVLNQYHRIRVARSGSTYTVSVTPTGGSTHTYTFTSSVNLLTSANTTLLQGGGGINWSNARVGQVSVTTGGATKYILPRAQTRIVDVLGSDGSSVAGSIVSGTLTSIYASRGDGSWKDPRVEHGGRIAVVESSTLSGEAQLPGDFTIAFSFSGPSSSGTNDVTIGSAAANDGKITLNANFSQLRIDSATTSKYYTPTATGPGRYVIVRSGTAIKLFKDGVLVNGPVTVAVESMNIGNNVTIAVVGSYVYDLAVWESALPDDDAQQESSAPTHHATADRFVSFLSGTADDFGWSPSYGQSTLIPAKLDDSATADNQTVTIPANKFGDPYAAIDRQAGNANTPFAADSTAPAAEQVITDVKTSTSSKCRARTTSRYKDRLGSSRNPQTRQLSEQFYGD